MEPLHADYHMIGTSSYYRQMLLKVLVCGYVSNIYRAANRSKSYAACKENIYFIGAARRFRSSMSYPDHNTINRFRGVRLKDALHKIFEEVVLLLA